jgi:peroxiredoxin
MLRTGEPLPEALREATVVAADGRRFPLADLARGGPALIVFIRHFGCIGCAEQVHGLAPRLPEIAALGVRVVLVGSGAPEHIDAFLERNALADKAVEVVTDPSLRAHEAAGLARSAWATFGPRAVVDFLRAASRGHLPRSTDGDLYQQGGAVLVDALGVVAWAHDNPSLGGHADPSDAVDAALRLRLERSPLPV